MRNYVRIMESDLPITITAQRDLSDKFWKEHILSYIQSYYKSTSNDEIAQIINKENEKEISQIETAIKKHIKKWFRKNEKFCYEGLIINDEPSAEGDIEGYYDFKIEHSYWNNTKSYFPFECKNLGTTSLLNEYVFVETEKRIDGGMFRYLIDKYAANQDFGGMIGFLIYKTNSSIIDRLIEKIEAIYSEKNIGKLTGEKIVRNSVFNSPNIFDSIHLRTENSSKQIQKITLHHVIMDFVNDHQ